MDEEMVMMRYLFYLFFGTTACPLSQAVYGTICLGKSCGPVGTNILLPKEMALLTPTPLTDEEFESLPWVLSCQKDSYELTKSATVVKCYELQAWASLYDSAAGVNGGEEGGLDSQNNGKKKKKKKKKKKNGNDSGDNAKEQPIEPKFGILFDDTVFFPEGGGQPFDTGVIEYNNSIVKVLNCQRFGPGGKLVLHYTAEPIPENSSVILKVNETRRTDHMLHHSSQHLITAVALNSYNRKTL